MPQVAVPLPIRRTYRQPARPVLVERAARAWWLAVASWFFGATFGQLLHGPAAWQFTYHYPIIVGGSGPFTYQRFNAWSLPGPLAVVVFGVVAIFLASLVVPMRDGARWARLLLTVLAVPAELVLLRQIGLSLFTGPATDGGVVQGVLAMIGFCTVPGAVSMMYRPSTHRFFHTGTGEWTKASPPL